jgi:serine/threonine protein kinase
VYEVGEEGDLVYTAMQHVQGANLRTLIEAEGPLPLARTVSIFAQVAIALDAAHARGLVHRNVKTRNVFVAPGPRPESVDHAYLSEVDPLGSLRPALILSIAYMAPEEIRSEPPDKRTDQYMLGCLLYERLTGEDPYPKEDPVAVLNAHLVEPPPRLSVKRPDLPSGIDVVVATSMAKSRDDRYPGCAAMIEAARRVAES